MPTNSQNKNRNLVLGLVATLWLLLVLVGYYYTHKPFEPQFLISSFTAFLRMFIAIGMIVLSGGVGSWIFPKSNDYPALIITVLQAALGAGVLGYAIFVLGITVGFHLTTFSVLFIATGLIFRKNILTWIRGWKRLDLAVSKSKFNLLLASGVSLILWWTLVTALAPPLHFDALTYHLALPRLYLLQGNMDYTPDLMFWGMPQLLEMSYTAAMAFGGAEAASTLGWGFGVLTLVGLFEFMRNKFNSQTSWVTVACLLSGYSLVTSLSSGYTEWFIMLLSFGMLVSFDAWRDTHNRRNLFMAAIFAGLALSVKYTAGQLILIGLVIIFWDGWRNKEKSTFRDILVFGAIAVLLTSPWWIKNWLAVANPFYPLLFPSGEMSQARLDYYSGIPWGNWMDMLILPWQVTIWGIEGKIGFSSSIGPLLLGFSTLSWIGLKRRVEAQKLLFSTSIFSTMTGFTIWALLSRWNGLLIQTRLYAAFFPAWAMLGGMGYDALSGIKSMGIRFGRIAGAVLILVFAFNLIEIGQDTGQRSPLGVLTGRMEVSSYLEQALGGYEPAMSAIKKLPEGSRVLMLWETRSFGCLPVCEPDEIIDRWYDDSLKYQSAEDVLAAWKSQGYTHILLNVSGYNYVRESDTRIAPERWDMLDVLLKSLPEPEEVAPGYRLYRIDLQYK